MTITTEVWKQALYTIMKSGREVSPLSPGAVWRGSMNFELLAHQTVVPMFMPVVTSLQRKMGYRFLCAEAAWILSGDNRMATIAPYAKSIKELSDDGLRYFGAYGPKIVDQLSFVVDTLFKDLSSRQAVINIWREQPRPSKDTPCTLSLQFLIRGGSLSCVATMRSSDIVKGWCYDVFNFSMIAAVVALELRNRAANHPISDDRATLENLNLKNLYLTAGSQHLYKMDWDMAANAINTPESPQLRGLQLSEFINGQELVDHLWSLARKDGTARHRWLQELF
jgi:thymidylate synthase